jgi:hypothetical protein
MGHVTAFLEHRVHGNHAFAVAHVVEQKGSCIAPWNGLVSRVGLCRNCLVCLVDANQ